jgi:hypothetical protein
LLLQCCAVVDWRQIQGRIRRARTGPDAAAKLTALFDKTRDGMVAFELAQLMENQGQSDSAVHWYTAAAQRFRRADWKQKAAAALERLGAPVPAIGEEGPPPPLAVIPTIAAQEDQAEQPEEEGEAQPESATAQAAEGGHQPGHKKRRRGRRGGRRRSKRRQQQTAQAAAAPPAAAAHRAEREPLPARVFASPPVQEIEPEPVHARASAPPALRQGEPALASRMAQLESQLRRLIATPSHALDEVEGAPAGPGVYLLSDSDHVTHYYVEAARTLRIALEHLAKGRSGGKREAVSLRPALAEHLGISEAKVKDYLRKHCTVRWVQIDEGASHLAHFAVAVLRPALNE